MDNDKYVAMDVHKASVAQACGVLPVSGRVSLG